MNFDKNLELVRGIEEMASERGRTAAQLALAWLLARRDHIVPIPGIRHLDRLQENVAAADIELTRQELQRLEEISPQGIAVGTRYTEGGMKIVNG